MDVEGHWAETQINEWAEKGKAGGYPDGTFKPNENITRAEFVAMTNRAFEIQLGDAQADFKDVEEDQWYYQDIAAAAAKDYIGGYPDNTFKPDTAITRQEVASILTRLLNLEQTTEGLSGFEDAAQFPDWSISSLGAVVNTELMRGYPDNTFKHDRNITRAEALVTLDRSMDITKPTTFDQAGTYGPEEGIDVIEGDVTISADGVTLRNTKITGDLLLAEDIGEGDVTLKNVTVEGNTTIAGGGSESINLEDCNMPGITVTKDGVRVVASGNTTVTTTTLDSGATLVEIEVTGPGFENVNISETIPSGSNVSLEGDFEEVNVDGESNIEITKGSVKTLNVNKAANISGEGSIGTANINVNDVIIEQTPEETNVAEDVTAEVGGKTVRETAPAPGDGDGDGTPSDGDEEEPAAPRIESVSYGEIDQDDKEVTVTEDPGYGDATIETYSESGESKLDILFNGDTLGTWENLENKSNELSLAGAADKMYVEDTFNIILENLNQEDVLDTIYVKEMLTAIRESEDEDDKEIFYDTIFPEILSLVVENGDTNQVYDALNISEIYNAEGIKQNKIQDAVSGAVDVYQEKYSIVVKEENENKDYDNINDKFLSNIEVNIPNIENSEDNEWKAKFYKKIDYTGLYEATTEDQTIRNEIVDAVIETDIFSELKSNREESILVGLAVYSNLSDLSEETKDEIYDSIYFSKFIKKLTEEGNVEFVLTDEDDASLKTTYTLVAQ